MSDDNDSDAKPLRDARGRWKPGPSPNPKGRPKKKPAPNYNPGDIRDFGNTMIEVAANGRAELMDRRTALLNKMYESAMKGSVTAQRFMYKEFERNDERLAAARVQYDRLITEWIIENPDFRGLDDSNVPFDVQMQILGLQSLLEHYFPGQYSSSIDPQTGDDSTD